jgi:rhomboid protease GluP
MAQAQPNPDKDPFIIDDSMLEDTREDFERGMSYLPLLSLALITVNVIVFGWQLVTGALRSKATIVAAGALSRPELLQGEIWRLVSPMFLHGSFDHLIGNCLALYVLGLACEHAFGLPKTAIIYGLSGIVASILSVIMQPGPSVGASGAIFGLMGAIVVFFYKYQHEFMMRDRRTGNVIAAWGAYTIITGFLTPYVDNFAHIGGAIGGAAIAWCLQPQLLAKKRK